jgi:outer membrane protein assembly factor BamD
MSFRLRETNGIRAGLDLRFHPDSLVTSLTMPFTLPFNRCTLLFAVVLLLSLPARLAADVVWTPEGGWRIVGGATAGLAGEQASNALQLMNRARAAEEKHHYFWALHYYKKVTKKYERSIYAQEAFFHTALIRVAQHKYVKAFKAYQEIVNRFPNTTRFNEVIGHQYRIAADLLDGAQGRYLWIIPGFRNREASIGFFENVVMNAPYSEYAPVAFMSIAKAHLILHDPEESIDALDRMINTYPKSVLTSDAYLMSAQTYASMVSGPAYDQTAAKEAITYFQDFVILYPNDPKIAVAEDGLTEMKQELADSKINLGDYYLKYRRNFKAARVFYNEAITDFPDSPVAARARTKLAKVDALLAEQEKATAGGKSKPARKKWFLFF